jgi:hypothetical protein
MAHNRRLLTYSTVITLFILSIGHARESREGKGAMDEAESIRPTAKAPFVVGDDNASHEHWDKIIK